MTQSTPSAWVPYSRRAQTFSTFAPVGQGPQLYDKYAGEESEGALRAPGRPVSNRGAGAFDAMPHGGQAELGRRKRTAFGSQWDPERAAELARNPWVLKKIGQLTGLFPLRSEQYLAKELTELWGDDLAKMSRQAFLDLRQPRIEGVPNTRPQLGSSVGVREDAMKVADEILEDLGPQAPGIRYAFQRDYASRLAITYWGEKSNLLAAGTLWHNPVSGKASRGFLWANTNSPEYSRRITNLVSSQMFRLGGVSTMSLSDAGAKSYYRVATDLLEGLKVPEVARLSDLSSGVGLVDAFELAGKKVYISGPMSELENMNYDAFFRAERALAAGGADPINPARNVGFITREVLEGGDHETIRSAFMRLSLKQVDEADAVMVLGSNNFGSLDNPIARTAGGRPYRGVIEEMQRAIETNTPVVPGGRNRLAQVQLDTLRAVAKTRNAQTRSAAPGLGSSLGLPRGSRKMPGGGQA